MADTSQRKARIRFGSGTSLVEKNKEGATIPQGNEVAQNEYNVIRSENITFDNAENFNQSESAYNSTANQTYNEAEKLLQALETKKAMLSYTASFNSNEYTLDARTATISELIANGIEQDLQDKAVYLSPVAIENGFVAQFVAPANNTGSVTVKIQKYDGTYHTTLTAKKYSGINLVDLVADDIKQNQLYTLVVISGELVVFGIQPPSDFLQTQQRITLSYASPTVINYTAGGFIFDDFSGSGFVSAGSVNITDFYPTPENNKGYYLFAVKNLTTNESKVILSNSKTSPTPPSGFTKKKYIGALMTDGTGQIRAGTYLFKPDGTYHFTYDNSVQDTYHQNDSGAFQNYTIAIPNITGLAYVQTEVANDAPSAFPFIFLYQASKPNNIIIKTQSGDAGNSSLQGYIPVLGNSQIAKSWGGNANRRVYQGTLGWVDYVI